MGLGRCGGVGAPADQRAAAHRGRIGKNGHRFRTGNVHWTNPSHPPVTVGVRGSAAVVAQSRRGCAPRFATRWHLARRTFKVQSVIRPMRRRKPSGRIHMLTMATLTRTGRYVRSQSVISARKTPREAGSPSLARGLAAESLRNRGMSSTSAPRGSCHRFGGACDTQGVRLRPCPARGPILACACVGAVKSL